MRKDKKKKKVMILLIILLVISVGYALVASTLGFNGNIVFGKKNWNVYWDNPVVSEGSKSLVAPSIVNDEDNGDKTKAVWSVDFELPGEYYEFTIDAVNAGDIDAMITNIDNTVTPNLPNYISYKITYASGREVKKNHLLERANNNTPTVQTYKVRVEYLIDNVDASTINNMEESITYSYTFGITYGMANDDATDASGEANFNKLLPKIIANKDEYRNENQKSSRDIGIDKYGNVVNLDYFYSQFYYQDEPDPYDYYLYKLNTNTNTVEIMGDAITGATAAEFFEDGEWQLQIPQYIMFDGTDEFYPVTYLAAFFAGNYYGRSNDKKFTKFPDLPKTITTLNGTFEHVDDFTTITLPSHIKRVECSTFHTNFETDNFQYLIIPDDSQLEYFCVGNVPLYIVMPSRLRDVVAYPTESHDSDHFSQIIYTDD